MLDQIYISPSLLKKAQFEIYLPDWLLEKDYKFLGDKPKRTFVGYKYNSDGYSDHLPIILYIKKPIDIKQK